ncbi:hypothetical protein Bbelb_232080 [Branchiostoma belcheri]|nr:hypothetical protein Bbelb_232080 [Branchiostoma belcheri]
MAGSDQLFDILGGGEEVQITRDELKATLKEMGHNLPDDKIEEAMKILDKDNTGSINFSEFMEFCETHLPSEQGYNGGDITVHCLSTRLTRHAVCSGVKIIPASKGYSDTPILPRSRRDVSLKGSEKQRQVADKSPRLCSTETEGLRTGCVSRRITLEQLLTLEVQMRQRDTNNPNKMEEQLREVFQAFDTSGDGTISKAELAKALTQAGKQPPNQQMIDVVFARIDKDGKGSLDFNEFVAFIMSMPPPVDALRQAFEQMDTDGSGNLEKDELKKLLEMAGAGPMPDDALEDVITQIGGQDRKVSFDEFCKFISPEQQQA